MEEIIARQIIIEHLENRYQKPYAETCLGGNFDLKFIPEKASGEKEKHRAVWVASFFLDLTELEETHGTEFFPLWIEIYLDDETREIWLPSDPYKKLTSQEKRAARKERRQTRRNSNTK
jgi:hypothetical protein